MRVGICALMFLCERSIVVPLCVSEGVSVLACMSGCVFSLLAQSVYVCMHGHLKGEQALA